MDRYILAPLECNSNDSCSAKHSISTVKNCTCSSSIACYITKYVDTPAVPDVGRRLLYPLHSITSSLSPSPREPTTHYIIVVLPQGNLVPQPKITHTQGGDINSNPSLPYFPITTVPNYPPQPSYPTTSLPQHVTTLPYPWARLSLSMSLSSLQGTTKTDPLQRGPCGKKKKKCMDCIHKESVRMGRAQGKTAA